MTRIGTALFCTALLATPGMAQKKATGMTDQDFVKFAAQTDMVEANLGQLAQSAAAAQDVRDFGQTLASDHTQDYGQLIAATKQANLTVPTSIDSEHNKAMIDPFQKLKGAAFDKRFAQDMVAGHSKALAVYQKEAVDATDPAIKSYAQAAVPTLQKHLAAAKALGHAKAAAE
jgi:putative membrane protein